MTIMPGPWKAEKYVGNADNWFVRGPDDKSICGRGAGPVTEGNAKAIAAVPDMVDTLRGALACSDSGLVPGDGWFQSMREALAKAGLL